MTVIMPPPVKPVRLPQTWFDPQPPDGCIRLPRRFPKKIVPSFIGESGQVLNLLMHHGAGGVVRDYSGFNNLGTINGATWVDGSYGWALRYDGLTNRVIMADSPSLRVTGEITILAWIYITDPKLWPIIYVKGILNTTLRLNAATRRLQFITGDGTLADFCNQWPDTIPLNEWHQVGAVYVDAANEQRIYVDGVTVQVNPAAAVSMTASVVDASIGARFGGTDPLEGNIALLSVYNVDKGDTFIRRAFESTRAIFDV